MRPCCSKQLSCRASYLVRVGAEEEEVEGDGRDEVDDEPAAEVVDRDLGGLADDLVVLRDVGRAEVDEDVDNEHDVDWKKGRGRRRLAG